MLAATVARLEGLIPPDRIVVATNNRLAAAVAEQLPQLRPGALLAEPCKRDTGPGIGLAALALLARDPEAVMLVCPSDHVIEPKEKFQAAIRLAEALVQERPYRLVTFGIRPTYPAESFGYIQRGERCGIAGSPLAVYQVQKFREKPKAAQAREYLATGEFYWNSGIFVWRAETIRQALAACEPEMLAHLEAISRTFGTAGYPSTLAREFAAIRPVSIDYAVMEHAADVAVIEAPFSWDDVGSWQALSRLLPRDQDENVVTGRHIGLGTSGCIIRSAGNHLTVTLGARDLIIVHTPDATLVASKHDEESIRHLAKLLEEQGLSDYL